MHVALFFTHKLLESALSLQCIMSAFYTLLITFWSWVTKLIIKILIH